VQAQDSSSTVERPDLQQQVQQWSMMIQVVRTLFKEVTDALKGVVQKSA
jgi:type III secretion protein F